MLEIASTQANTQKEAVMLALQGGAKSIHEVTEATGFLRPNVRRILGVGAKEGVFSRVEKGVYVLSRDGEDVAIVETGDAVESLPRLAREGFKSDMIFLDVPYSTVAVRGGNRGTRYELVTPNQFRIVARAVSDIMKTPDTPVVYMYSQAISGMKEMNIYNRIMTDEAGFIPIARGEYTKLQKDGFTRTRNMRGMEDYPELLIIFNKSGRMNPRIKDFNLSLIRPKGYQTEKPAELLRHLINMTTEEGEVVLDPFAGSGVTGEQAVMAGRKAYLIEKSMEAVEAYIKPRLERAMAAVRDRVGYPQSFEQVALFA